MNEETFSDNDEEIISGNRPLSSVQMLRSELAQEIISRRAGFLEKWALLIFLGILLVLFGGTWFVHYPDVVTATAVLTANNNPKEITVKQEGRLIKLFPKTHQPVKQNEVIGWMESSADYDQVSELSRELDRAIELLTQNQPQLASTVINVNFNKLGELQHDYEQFLLSEDAFSNYLSDNKNFGKAMSKYKPDRMRIVFQEQIASLLSKVQAWRNKYELQSSIDGRIALNENIGRGDYLRAGTVVGYVIPSNSIYFMESVLPQNNFGKLDTGQHVQLRFEAYPYEEWGFVNGTISNIESVPTGSGFKAVIKLDNGLITSNRRKLPYRSGLRAQALVITKDMRLLQKFYYGFVKSTSVNK